MNAVTSQIKTAEPDEVPFEVNELFYSRTDKRGVIRSGNALFQWVSGFEWAQLLGAPHRIVHHQDTPKAVFRILWQTIQQGEPVVAYVKNKARDGRHYWVLATVLPLGDGYLSVGIKPTSLLFATVRREYAAVVAQERAEALSPEVSADRLLLRLQSLGFADYKSFMLHALSQEYEARNAALDRASVAHIGGIGKVRSCLDRIIDQQDSLLQEFNLLRDLPTNMRIIASRLEPTGGPVSAISENYKVTSIDLSRQIKDLAVGEASLLKRMTTSFGEAVFQMNCARLQSEVVRQYQANDVAVAGFDLESENGILSGLATKNIQSARAAMAEAEQVSASLNLGCSDIRRSMLGLDTIRVMGRVESGRMGGAGTRLAATIDQLDSRHSAIIAHLQAIMDLSTSINAGVRRIRKQFDVAQPRSAFKPSCLPCATGTFPSRAISL
jgi:PAS domain S-box-containing protein